MGNYVQYSITMTLDCKIPNNYIQALNFFAKQQSTFTDIEEIKEAFPLWIEHIDAWDFLVYCNSYYVENDHSYKNAVFSLVQSGDYYYFNMLSQCKEKATTPYMQLLEWLKPYIILTDEPAIGYHLGLSYGYDKRIVLLENHKINVTYADCYSSTSGIIYRVSGIEYLSLDDAVGVYKDIVDDIGGVIGFGFDSDGLELEIFKNHFRIHTIFSLYDFKLSITDLRAKVERSIALFD